MTILIEQDFGTKDRGNAQTVSLEIDGQTITAPVGISVMRAAELAGISIPRLCATDTLEAFGSCRLCLVEVKGKPGTPASCTTLVEDGLQVITRSEKLQN
ncbi:NAD-dependent formate dehydrogenase alpha subunit, partial [hydrothermal vent metagenome]